MPKKPAAKVVAAAAPPGKEKKEEDCGSSGSGATTSRAAAARKVLRALKRWQQKKHAQLISTLHNKDDVDPITLDAVRDIPRDSLFVLVTESGQKHGYDSQAWAQALAKDARHPSTRERLRPEAIHACVCAASTFAKRHPDQASPALVRAVRRLRTPVTLVHIEQRPPRRPRGRYLRAAARGIRRKLRWMLILRVSPLFVLKSVKVSGRISEPVIEYDIEDSRSTSGVGPLADRGAWRTRGRSRSQSVTPTARGGQEGAASADASAADAADAADASGEFAASAAFAASATSVASTITVGGLGSMARSAAGSLFNSSGRRVLYSVDDAAGGAGAGGAGGASAASAGAASAGAAAAGRRGSASSSVGPSHHSSGSYKPSILAKSVQDKGLVAFASDEGMARDASDLVEDILAGHTSLEDLNGELTDGETDDEDAEAHSQAEASVEEAARVAAPAPAAAAESAVGGGEEGNGGGESDGDSWATATSGSDGDDDDDDDSDFVP